MAKIQLLPTESMQGPEPIDITTQVTLGQGTNPNTIAGSQVWIITGCAYSSGGGIKATVTLQQGGATVSGELQRFENDAGEHHAWPPLYLASTFPQDCVVSLQITGVGTTQWSSQDSIQIAVVSGPSPPRKITELLRLRAVGSARGSQTGIPSTSNTIGTQRQTVASTSSE